VPERLEEAVEGVQVDDFCFACHVLWPPVDEKFPRHHDRYLTGAQVLKPGDVVGVGERRPVHDHFVRVEVFVYCGATGVAAAGAVEAQPSRHDQFLP